MDYQKAKDELHHDNVKKDTAKLHCKDDEVDLIALKTKEEDVSAFYSKIDSVFTSQRYYPNRRSTAIKVKGDERVYIMAPTKAQSVLTKAVFGKHNKYFDEPEPSQGTSVPPGSRHNNVQDLTKQNNKQNDEVTMLSPVSDAPPQPSQAVQGERGVIVAKEKEHCLVHSDYWLKHMAYAEAVAEGHIDKVKDGSNKLNSPDDLKALETLKNSGNSFSSTIESVLTTELYGSNRRSTAIKLTGDTPRIGSVSGRRNTN
ncbi:hypothetical protein T440DRAFT_523248 [Plenodomus tracheiphilus IPT5]|uniref:Uncharacterized protein n=1 Tax=Plenodomus tracheiphilus IPT5 TaxID=1408161 RepID=A0A6A7ANB9_9PLEO|nr:hypothetical protein T440DRAFT_523248 [Plenodomus tracheiphilus IPT5]